MQSIALQYQILDRTGVDISIEQLLGEPRWLSSRTNWRRMATEMIAELAEAGAQRERAVTELLDQLDARGLSVTAAGADLRLQGPRDRIDADLVGRIKTVKPELIEFLQAQQAEAERGFDVTLLQRGYLIGRGDAVELGNIASHVYHEMAGTGI